VEPWSVEWKAQRLEDLYLQWKDCQKCQLCKGRTNVVFGDGHPDADIMLIGAGPGANEDKNGYPFVGDSGALLRSMISGVELKWEDLYVTNVVGCLTPNDRDPTKEERAACTPRLHEIIYIVDPLLIIPIGKYTLNALVGGRSWGIESEQGKLFSSPSPMYRVAGERNGAEIPGRAFPMKGNDKFIRRLEYDVIPIFQPSYILKTDSFDTHTQSFAAGGPFFHTMDSLETAVLRVAELKDKRARVARLLERI